MSLPDVRRTGSALDEPIAELFFQSGSPAGSMKDLVRGFIRKATMVGVFLCEMRRALSVFPRVPAHYKNTPYHACLYM